MRMIGTTFYPVNIGSSIYNPFPKVINSKTDIDDFMIGNDLPVIDVSIFRKSEKENKPIISDDESESYFNSLIPDSFYQLGEKFIANSVFAIAALALILIGIVLLFGEVLSENKETIIKAVV